MNMRMNSHTESSRIIETKVVKGERAFKLSLPALVSGINSTGNSFEERTTLQSISSQEACFSLSTRVNRNSKLSSVVRGKTHSRPCLHGILRRRALANRCRGGTSNRRLPNGHLGRSCRDDDWYCQYNGKDTCYQEKT